MDPVTELANIGVKTDDNDIITKVHAPHAHVLLEQSKDGKTYFMRIGDVQTGTDMVIETRGSWQEYGRHEYAQSVPMMRVSGFYNTNDADEKVSTECLCAVEKCNESKRGLEAVELALTQAMASHGAILGLLNALEDVQSAIEHLESLDGFIEEVSVKW